jgi:hypothetical protein
MPATAAEQYLLELINDLRLSPLASSSRLITSFDPITSSDPTLEAALLQSGVSGPDILAALQATLPTQPLAFNEALATAADFHSAAMIAADTLTDQTATEAGIGNRLFGAGYAFQSAAEIVRLGSTISSGLVAGSEADQQALSGAKYREIGIGAIDQDSPATGAHLAITEDIATTGTAGSFLLGVAYDDTDNNGFYSIGEGIAGLTVSVGNTEVTTSDSGGYTLPTSLTGVQQVTLSGGGLAGPVGVQMAMTDATGQGLNAKLDVIDGTTLHISTSAIITGAVTTVVGLGTLPLTITLGDGIGRTIVGGTGNDTLTGNSGDDIITGSAGNDTIDGGAGTNILAGGGGSDTVVFDFASTDATIRSTGAGWVVSTPGTTDTVSGFETYQFTDTTVTTLAGLRPATASDFNRDGQSDLLVENNQGTMQILAGNGMGTPTATSLGAVDPSWHIMATGDFNGDGQPDILMQSDTGAMVEYLMNGTSIGAGYSFGNAGSDWHIRGAADFDSDGRTEFLTQRDDGSLVIFKTDGTGLTEGFAVGQSPSNAVDVEGIADFDSDGSADILVQEHDGSLAILNIDNDGIAGISDLGAAEAGYSVAGIGDYTTDGLPDIVLHSLTGQDIIWEITNNAVSKVMSAGDPGANYSTAVVGSDLNGDGHSDLIDQSSDGTMQGYEMDGSATITLAAVLEPSGGNWRLTGSNPVVYKDGSGAHPNLVATPGLDEFVFKSYADGVHTITGFTPSQDTVALNVSDFPTYAAVQAHEAAYQGGTFVSLSPTAALVIQGVTPDQLSAGNFTLR